MKTITSNYEGQLRISSIHTKSQNSLLTDAPTDNNGKGEAFSPTDLVATALINCMMTVMGIKANQNSWNIVSMYGNSTKHMESSPRRIGKLEIEIFCEMEDLTAKKQSVLEHTALNCPVAKSISTAIETVVAIKFA